MQKRIRALLSVDICLLSNNRNSKPNSRVFPQKQNVFPLSLEIHVHLCLPWCSNLSPFQLLALTFPVHHLSSQMSLYKLFFSEFPVISYSRYFTSISVSVLTQLHFSQKNYQKLLCLDFLLWGPQYKRNTFHFSSWETLVPYS